MKYQLPSGSFTIRVAKPPDAASIASLHVKTFNQTHGFGPDSPGLTLREKQWKNTFESDGDKDWFCLVIENAGGELIGFTKGIRYLLNDLPFEGELNKIYLLREYQGHGLGKLLLRETAKQFLNRNISSMLLFGDANSASNAFYEAMGAEKLLSKDGEFHGGYGWKNLNSLLSAES
jgi:GNAT superfamily N-acetyltransferase